MQGNNTQTEVKKQKLITGLIYNPLVRVMGLPYILWQQQKLEKSYRKSPFGERIRRYRDLHRGRRCFVVANGPSLTIADLNTLHERHEICFGMNDIFKLFDRTDWRPDYYFVYDRNYMRLKYDQVVTLPMAHMFFAYRKVPSGRYFEKDNIEYYNTEYVFSVKPEAAVSRQICTDLSDKVSFSASTTQVCIEFAIYMGFREIYLIGVDHNYSFGAGKNHAEGMGDAAYFGGKQVFQATPSTQKYQQYRDYADKNGIRILNATRGGKLEVYERADFDSLWK